MRMYELWRVKHVGEEPERLEDEGGAVLFPRACDAEDFFRRHPDRWEAECRILPVTVGQA
ncbi:MAG: hypothetical protein A2Z31_04010 [candidate division NC10 bacterium RBG_16_65_8]|nr:MAG: hypothetical protein A2Z31_04010 [candidate division NC10 bacterium RBG_16_65_8]